MKQSKGGDLSLRTVVNLPNGSGKKNKLAVLCEPDKISEAKKAGADLVGSDDLIDNIASRLYKGKDSFEDKKTADIIINDNKQNVKLTKATITKGYTTMTPILNYLKKLLQLILTFHLKMELSLKRAILVSDT